VFRKSTSLYHKKACEILYKSLDAYVSSFQWILLAAILNDHGCSRSPVWPLVLLKRCSSAVPHTVRYTRIQFLPPTQRRHRFRCVIRPFVDSKY